MKRLFLKRGEGFTLVELLVVIIIIAILAGLTLSIIGNVTNSAKKSRAAGEVAALELALSRFQVDNGFFPQAAKINMVAVGSKSVYNTDPTSTASTNVYKISGRALFLALTGRTMYNYAANANTNGYRQYYPDLKLTQVGDAGNSNTIVNPDPTVQTTYTTNAFNAGSYIQDPYQNAYGYYYSPAGYNQAGDMSLYNRTAPDIWSTCGETGGNKTTNTYLLLRWAHNWPQNASP